MPSMLFRLFCNQVVPPCWAPTMKKTCMTRGNGEPILPRIAVTLNRPAKEELSPSKCSPQKQSQVPTVCYRATQWDEIVEQNWRVQQGGWRDAVDYASQVDNPSCWPNGLLRCVKQRATGFMQYFPRTRECEDGMVPQVKLYEYGGEEGGGGGA